MRRQRFIFGLLVIKASTLRASCCSYMPKPSLDSSIIATSVPWTTDIMTDLSGSRSNLDKKLIREFMTSGCSPHRNDMFSSSI